MSWMNDDDHHHYGEDYGPPRRSRGTGCVCGPDLPGSCPGQSNCPYANEDEHEEEEDPDPGEDDGDHASALASIYGPEE